MNILKKVFGKKGELIQIFKKEGYKDQYVIYRGTSYTMENRYHLGNLYFDGISIHSPDKRIFLIDLDKNLNLTDPNHKDKELYYNQFKPKLENILLNKELEIDLPKKEEVKTKRMKI